jgi:UDP-N-acetylmuramyl pentapeptide phosphotransferase/UDP-N-acetylglucosamine-1-phosphate transferase
MVPKPLHSILGQSVDLGKCKLIMYMHEWILMIIFDSRMAVLYLYGNGCSIFDKCYKYLGLVFCFIHNVIAITINNYNCVFIAGINGLECGQSFVIAISVLVFNSVEVYMGEVPSHAHMFSIHLLLPFIATSAALLRYNW